jgi:hypothetical protein
MDVVIGTSPFAAESVVVGPFRSPEIAYAAARQLEHLGYVAETCQLIRIQDIPALDGAGEWD